LPDGVRIYGGFLGNATGGGETARSQRNPEENETILSGDIGTLDDPDDNAYHVVTALDCTNATVLSGFTITGGNASSSDDLDGVGGGLLVVGSAGGDGFSSPQISRCRFIGNAALASSVERGAGGGAYVTWTDTQNGPPAQFVNCTFAENSAQHAGGGGYVRTAMAHFTNCVFVDNSTLDPSEGSSSGGALGVKCALTLTVTSCDGPLMTVTNCTFAGNSSPFGSAVSADSPSEPAIVIQNAIFWDNDPNVIRPHDTSLIEVTYSDVEGGWSGTGNINADPLFCGGGSGILRLQPESPCIDAGSDVAGPLDITNVDDDTETDTLPWDIIKLPRVVNAKPGSNDVDMGAYEHPTTLACPADLDVDHDVDLTDLSLLLGCFGTLNCEQNSCCAADFTCDGDVGLEDLAILLAAFGEPCGFTPGAGNLSLSIEAYDTGGYTGGGFAGEEDHFVFDLLIEIDAEDDDWTTTGLCAARANGATFRLVADPNDPPTPGASPPGKYSTFFSVPKGVNVGSRFNNPFPTGGIAGSCHPLSGAAVYTTTTVHACWLDSDLESDDGPAAIARIVLDVSGVSGADTSGGLGSVYFSTTGPNSGSDIKVGDLHASTAHKDGGGALEELEGEFYVVGE
jgi:hypothetical protein